MYSGEPTVNSAVPITRSSIQVVPKLYHMYQERRKRKEKSNMNISFSKNAQNGNFEMIEEEKHEESKSILS